MTFNTLESIKTILDEFPWYLWVCMAILGVLCLLYIIYQILKPIDEGIKQ